MAGTTEVAVTQGQGHSVVQCLGQDGAAAKAEWEEAPAERHDTIYADNVILKNCTCGCHVRAVSLTPTRMTLSKQTIPSVGMHVRKLAGLCLVGGRANSPAENNREVLSHCPTWL